MPTSKVDPHTESNASDRGFDAVEQTKRKLSEFGAAAADKVEQNRGTAAAGLEGAAETLHHKADQLHEGGEKVADLAHSAADKLSATADYVRTNDLNDMLKDVQQIVKKKPWTRVGGCRRARLPGVTRFQPRSRIGGNSYGVTRAFYYGRVARHSPKYSGDCSIRGAAGQK